MLLQVLIIELDMLHVQLENYTLLLQVVIELYFVTSSADHRIGCAACTARELYFVTSGGD